MESEAEYLAAIRERPNDHELRLALAAFLVDRGDPRGELLALEERARALPKWSDEYWRLKPELFERRSKVDSGWLDELGFGPRYRPVFTDIPSNVKGRWRLIREYFERWQGCELGDVGRSSALGVRFEEELQRPLPRAVHEWLALDEDLFRNLGGLGENDGARTHFLSQDLVVLSRSEDYETWGWAVMPDQWSESDPLLQEWHDDKIEGQLYGATDPPPLRMTEFALQYYVPHGMLLSGFRVPVEDVDAALSELRAQGASVAQLGGVSFLELPGALVGHVHHKAISVALQRPEYAETLPELLREDGLEYMRDQLGLDDDWEGE